VDEPEAREFFISYTQADRPWAEWLAWELEANGHRTLLQAWDMPAGSAFIHAMDQAVQRTRHTMLVLSPAYLRSAMAEAEWRPGFAADPSGKGRRLLPVRVEDCQPTGLLADRVWIDLVGLDEASARAKLGEDVASALRGHARPTSRPRFPRTPPPTPSVERPRFPTALPPVWSVPYRRNPAFTGREEVLAGLAEQLDQGAAAVTQTLQGAGGVGKTALAVEYAYRHRSRFDTVWWIRAEEPASLIGDYADLASALGSAEAAQANQQLAALAARRWLEGHDRWLLVLDNAEGPDATTGLQAPLARLIDLLPQVLHGQVLVTSRDASWEQHAALAELDLFSPSEAVAFLLARSGRNDQATATQIAELLGLLPLALEQAGAYLRETRLSLTDYLDRLQQYPALTLARGRPRDHDPADTVATTWRVSLERVRPTPGAVAVLEVCAFLGPEEVPRELFAEHLDPPAQGLDILAADPFALDDAVAALRRFGLVKANEQALTVHRLLQQVVRDQLDLATRNALLGIAVRLLDKALPFGSYADPGLWPVCARLLPHALVAIEHAVAMEVEPLATAHLLDSAADYLHGRARYAEARSLRERVVSIREARLGPHHPDTADSLNNLAAVLDDQGDLEAARRLNERALQIYEIRLGPDHPRTATSLINLARVLHLQGDLEAARRLHERALTIRETRLGPDHPDTAEGISTLASVLHEQGDLEAARRLHERALAIRETRLGPEHPYTAISLHNLAHIRHDEGDLEEARTLFERSLSIHEASLGPDHPYTAHTLTDLAVVLADEGDLAGARRLHERALTIVETRLGADNPNAAFIINNLAVVLADEGDLAGARGLHERALQIREARLGPDHPDTAQSRRKLAGVLARLKGRH
jgi:tetratricopeptide (TPR) repeat protein